MWRRQFSPPTTTMLGFPCLRRADVLRTVQLGQRRWISVSARRLAETADGPAVTQTNKAEATMKRFWKDVDVAERDGGYVVTLDRRALKTPSGNTLLLPRNKFAVASLIAAEWESQSTVLKPHALPITSLASRAIDAFTNATERAQVQKGLLDYLHTDTICFHQDEPHQLVTLQKQHWDPLLDWARKTYGVDVRKAESLFSSTQPPETADKLAKALDELDQWELASFERATHVTKSFLIALALVKRCLNVEQAANAAHVEVNSQIQRWGEVEDTHDVDYHDVRRQLGSAACLLMRV
ncbi:hypothetical protein EV122DRAFT_261665 [Schizophyllum commune]